LLGCAFYSIVHEHKATHSEIIKLLIEAGAIIEPGTLEWWEEQNVLGEPKKIVRNALRRANAV